MFNQNLSIMRKHLFKWMLLLVAFMAPLATNAQNELTVHDGTATSQYVPTYVLYWDDFTRCQFVIPASELEEMIGGTITSLTFYTNSTNMPYTSVSTADVYMMEVDYTEISAFEDKNDVLYSGTFEFVATDGGGMVTIEFTNSYVYGGGNLLIGIENITDAGYKGITFYGETVSGAAVQGYNSSSLASVNPTQRNFIPKTTFTYLPGGSQVCFKPTGLSVIPYADAATFSWNPVEGVVGYEWLYYLASENIEPNWDEADIADGDMAEIMGLEPNTSYVAYVRSICDFGISNPSAITFKTACSAYEVTDEVPYVYGFETADELSCWILGTATRYGNSTYSTYSHSGDSCLRMYGASVLTVLPDFAEVNRLQLDFYARVSSTSYASTLEVGYMSNPTDASTFETVKTFASSEFDGTNYALCHAGLATVPEGARIAIRHTSTSSYAGWYLDDFTVSRMPSCVAPDVLTVSEITTESATIGWTPGLLDDNTWEIEYRDVTDGEEAAWMTVGTTGDNPYYLGNLTANTPYEVRVRTYCNEAEQSDWTAVASFRTACNTLVVDGDNPFVENFNDADFAFICWTNEHVEGPGNKLWEHNTSVSASTVHEGAGSLKLPDMNATTYTMLALPAMNLDESAEGYEVSFWMYRNTGSKPNEGVKLWVNNQLDTVNGAELMHVARAYNQGPEETQETGTGWYKYTAEIPAEYIGGTTYVIFMGISEYGNFSNLDDITVQAVSSCETPGIGDVAAVTATSATLTWTSGEGTTNWQLKNGEEIIDVAIDDVLMNDNNVYYYTLNGLQANTEYTVQLRSVCSGVNSAWADGAFNFTTLSDENDVTDVYIENMVDYDIDEENHAITVVMLYGSDFTAVNGSIGVSEGATVWVGDEETEGFFEEADLSTPFTFTVKAEDPTYAQEWTITLVNESCATVTELNVEPERVKATLTWNIGDVTVENFDLCVSESALDNFDGAMWQTINVPGETTTRSYELTGLERGTTYYVYLMNTCTELVMDRVAQVTFTTHDLNECIEYVAGTGTMTQAPLYNNYGGEYSIQIYTAEQLTAQGFAAGEITGIAYYLATSGSSTVANKYTKTGTVWMMNTDKASFADNSDWITSGFTLVKEEADVEFAPAASWIELPFDHTFVWDGTSNLAVATLFVSTGSYMTSSFRGGSVGSNQVIAGYSDNTSLTVTDGVPTIPTGNPSKIVSTSLPNIKLCFASEACPAVELFDAENIGSTTATLTWETAEGDYLEGYEIAYSTELIQDFEGLATVTIDADATAYDLQGLTPYMPYYAFIRAICGNDEGNSEWIMTEFHTQSNCYAPTNLTATLTDRNAVSVLWDNELNSDVQYVLSIEERDDDMLEQLATDVLATDELEFTDLEYEMDYILYVRHNCGELGVSPWVSTTFTTMTECPMVENIETEATYSTVTIDFENGEFSPATSWHIVVEGVNNDHMAFDGIVTELPYTVIGLFPESEYVVSIGAVCGEVESEYNSDIFTTEAMPGDCETVANGTNTNSYLPFYGNWMDASQHNQILYPAEMLANLQGEPIESMKFFVNSGTNANTWDSQTITVKLMETDATSLTDGFVDVADASTVFTGYLTANTTDGMVVAFDEPYTYNGGNLLVDFESETNGEYTSVYFVGTTATGAGRYSYNSTNSIQNFLPKVDFCVTPSDCHAVRNLAVSNVTTNSAEISWMPGSYETEWQMVYSTTVLTAEDLDAANYVPVDYINFSLTDLEANNTYYVYVRPVCAPEDEFFGDWKMVSFALERSYYEITIEDTVCGEYILKNTANDIINVYNESGEYEEVYNDPEFGMVHATLNLVINEIPRNYEYVESCVAYTWAVNDRTYNKSGLKTFKGTTDAGCPSYDTLDLNIIKGYSNYESVEACGPYTWEVDGKTYNKSGVKTFKSAEPDADGCYTYDTLNLVITDLGGNYESVTNCGPYEWEADGKTYNTSGEKIYTYTDGDGCFHRDTLNLTVITKVSSYESVEACGPYTWEKTGATYNKSGVKYFKGTAEDGCPEYDTLDLVIIPAEGTTVEATACGSYTWDVNNTTYNKSGQKIFTSVDGNGCYHVDTLNLTIIKGYSNVTDVTACVSYYWDVTGKTYNKSGVKTFKSAEPDPDGCYTYDTLNLTIIKGYGNHEYVTACGPYTWDVDGKTYSKAGVKTFKSAEPDADGCYTYDTLTLTINDMGGAHVYVEHCAPYVWDVDGKSYNQSGDKIYTSLDDNNCYHRDTLSLTIVKYSNHEYVTACGPYTWEVNNKTYNKSGEKYYKAIRPEDGCPEYDTLTLVIENCQPNDPTENFGLGESVVPQLSIYPNPTTGRLQIDAAQVDKVEVLDLVGRCVAVFEKTNTLDLTNLAAGTYTLRVTMPEGVELRKVVKR